MQSGFQGVKRDQENYRSMQLFLPYSITFDSKKKPMKNKVLTILFLGFLSQIILSCCDCSEAFTYQNLYTGVTIIPYDISGFNAEIATDTVYKNAFGLGVMVNFETKLAVNAPKPGLGFNAAVAISCDCVEDSYVYPDPISHFDLYMIDAFNGEKTKVNQHFKIVGYNGELISLEEFFPQRQEWHDGFQIELVTFDAISNSVIFEVEVFLKSDRSFTGQTEVVNFF